MKFYRILLPLIGFILAAATAGFAQGSVSGTVTSAVDEEPIPGVNLLIEGTSRGTATDADGRYSIGNIEPGSYSLLVRFVGYRPITREFTIENGDELTLHIELSQGSLNLDAVVVTGTGGPVEVRKLGNTVGVISAADLQSSPLQNFSEALQGRVPGMVGLPSSGVTGEGSRIRIRGSSSLSQSNEPIVFVDGVRVDGGGGFGGSVSSGGSGSPSRLDDINPESIDRVEVLKGAAAATLYGTEASNGVIQVFTKNGRVDDPQFDFKVSQGFINFPKVFPDNTGFARTQAQADTMSYYFNRQINPYELVSENYVHQLYETGHNQEYSGSISGGREGVTYYVNFRWTGEDGPHTGENIPYPEGFGPLANDNLNRFQTSANISLFPTDNLQIRFGTSYTDSRLETFQTGNNVQGVTSGAIHGKPELVGHDNRSGASYNSTIQERLQQTVSQDVNAFNTNVGLNYRPLEFLTIDGTFGASYTSQFSESTRPFGWNINNYASIETEGARRTSERSNLNLTADVRATALHQLGARFESSLIGGFQVYQQQNLVRSGTAVNFPGPGLNVTGAAANQNLSEQYIEETQAGLFIQEQLGFDDYIFATVGGRFDAHSAFGSEFNTVFYPKASLSFVFSDAPFWQRSNVISSLRVRAAVGQSGLQPGAFDALTTYTSLTSGSGAGIVPENLGNPNLRPEVSTEYEFGLDFGLFNERITAEVTYWDRTVTDALVQRNFPTSGGFLQPQLDNIGELKGKGLELGLQFNVLNRSDWSAEIFTNAAYLWEQVTDLGGAAPIKVGGSYPRYRQFLKEGYAPGTNFGAQLVNVPSGQLPLDARGLLETLGRDASGITPGTPASQDLVLDYLNSLTPGTASLEDLNNFVLLADENGNGDPLDHHLGKPTPDWQGSFGGTVRFRNFKLYTLFEYRAGNYYVNNLTDGFRQRSAGIGRNTPDAARVERDYMTGGVDSNFNPQNDGQVRFNAASEWINDLLALDPFAGLNVIQPADFIRLREVSFTYELPGDLLNRLNLRRASFTVSGRNLALWTKYPGVDPEVNAIGRGGSNDLENNFLLGTDAWNMPLPRRILFTFNLGI
ncbi:SusC/RagA family TonB-linked outer membrane protein [Rhodohalobacter sp. SW132]|uniref:SusC/RagA family TonB-linked outer membrane protein n=1 Tax=Rhodohalobacter sp. SW132 TaxID=2293433 RepID=UPI000E22AA6A|nr:SusC/RagA family TonB-linked outer membrane protein [Rhodohalobacter sp. SW132]REL25044.1 SusC/RagA family TonB-linked outer membrane protein [Rhodohalobacter sp. SW132]